MQKSIRSSIDSVFDSPVTFRKLAVSVAGVLIVLAVLALLTTRQIIFFDNSLQTLLFVLVVTIGFGIGSWILLEYAKRTSSALRAKSSSINRIHWVVTIIQFVLLAIMVVVIFYNSVYCYNYFSFCNTPLSTLLLTAVASASASAILGFFSYRFLSWYKTSNRNLILLFYGLATAALSMSIAGDAIDKFMVAELIVEEQSQPGTVPDSSFVYENVEKYDGEVQYRVTNPEGSTLYVVSPEDDELYSFINRLTSYPRYIFLWISTCLLLHLYYQRTGQKITKFPIKYWILLIIPFVLYLVGSGLVLTLPDDSDYRYYQRIIYRAGNIGSSILFGVAFYIIARRVPSERVKDYLTIAAIGITMGGIAFSVSAFQQTYGVSVHSLVFLSSYLFAIGFYASAVFLTQDAKLRSSIKKSAVDEAKLLVSLGTPHLEQEIERRVLNSAQKEEEDLIQKTGVVPSLTQSEMKVYLSNVLSQITLLHGYEDIVRKEREILESSKELVACLNFSGIRLAYNSNFEVYQKIMKQKSVNGEHKGIRFVTKVEKHSANMIKRFLDVGVQVKHVDNLPPIDFAVSDKEIVAKVHKVECEISDEKHDSGNHETSLDVKNVLVSTEQAYIDYFLYTFSELWNNGTNAEERIAYLEQGLEPEFTDVLNDGKKTSRILLELVKSIKQEAQILIPNERTLLNLEKIGAIDHIVNAAMSKHSKIRLVCPNAEGKSDIIKKIKENAPEIEIVNGNNSTSVMFIVDNTKFLRAELAKEYSENFADSIGYTVYSNTRQSIDSFKTFFDLLWREHILNEELKNADKVQKEFINIAAHELRTPIQPILGLSHVMYSEVQDPKQRQLLEVVVRNANRLKRLTDNILDVTRIESKKLRLNKEEFDISRVALSVVDEYDKINQNNGIPRVNVSFVGEFENSESKGMKVQGDQNRITEVISNLIDNSLKYTTEGRINVKTQRLNGEMIVSVSDTGKGIDPLIFPKLFTKFSSISGPDYGDGGTGLGLYISKSIVEAHGGRIWAQNNSDLKGATFSFSLPLDD
ncbi:MAG TPA: HAMP domain-containing sensor histidine kinase [Nitrososphaeraceae archaeon]|nr:HAMP domain-containing sensor histidine kinase [Nitrososphaeraceae archaeon]